MENDSARKAQPVQNNISAALILLNIFLSFVFVLCTPQHEDDFFMGLFAVAIVAVMLQALFVFTYKGKAPFAGKIILAVLISLACIYGAFIWYVAALGKAFQH